MFIMRRGRPQKQVNWPDSAFTSNEALIQSEKVSPALVHLRLKEALSNGTLKVVGKVKKTSRGRPTLVYSKA